MRIIIENIYLTLVLAFAGINISLTAESVIVSGDQEIFGDYYSFLAEIAPEPLDNQIEKLTSYIQTQPLFERPYHQLLTLYFEKNQLDEAERYFKLCLTQSDQKRNGSWALAMLAAVRDSNDIAFADLKKVLQENAPTPYLLMEFAEYFRAIDSYQSFDDILDSMTLSARDRLIALAFHYVNLGEFEKCASYLAQINIDDSFKLYALHMNAFIHQSQGALAKAESLYAEGLAASKQIGDEQFSIQFQLSLAQLRSSTQPQESLRLCNDALQDAKNIHDVDRMIAAHELLSRLFMRNNEFEAALDQAQQALDIAAQQFHRRTQVRILILLGQIHLKLTNHAKALDYFNKSIEGLKDLKEVPLRITALREKGYLYMDLNLYDLANHEFTQAIKLADSSAYPLEYNIALIHWAIQLYETGNFEKSRYLLCSAIDSGHLEIPFLVYAYFHLATCYEIEENFKMALETYEKVCQIVEEHFEIESIHYFKAVALPQRAALETRFGNFAKAESLLVEPILRKEMNGNIGLQYDFYNSRAYLKFSQQDLDGAIENYLMAAGYVEKFQQNIKVEHFRIGHYEETSEVYHKLVMCLYKRYSLNKNFADLEQAFTALQKCSGRSLQDMAPRKKKTDYSPEYVSAVDSLQHLQRRLRDSVWKEDASMTAALHVQHDVARHALLNQRGLMLEEASFSKAKDISLHELQHICRLNNMNTLLYYISDSLSFSFVVQPDTIAVIPLTLQRDSVAAQVTRLVSPLHQATEEQLDAIEFRADIAYILYNTIFKPITDRISLSENLFIIPDMALLNIPFEMLLTAMPSKNVYTPKDSADYAQFFLQHEHTFTYSPSLAPLFEQQSEPHVKSLVVFSNPTFYSKEFLTSLGEMRSVLRSIFVQLPFADEEAKRIAETTNAKKIQGDEATKPAVFDAMQKYTIVHIATHAFVDSVFDAYSGLALATANANDDGLLMGYELLDISLENDLIVLSACESGAGKSVAGEGVLGLPRLFLRAGVHSVLMSLWKVQDEFPTQLMPAFYDYYLKQNKTKAAALALAKRQVLSSQQIGASSYKHPFYWATFCLYGSPGYAPEENNNKLLILGIGIALLVAVATFTFYKKRQFHSEHNTSS